MLDDPRALGSTGEEMNSPDPFYAEPHFCEEAFLGHRRRAGDRTSYITVDPTRTERH
jgi:hypothetical protein